MIQESIQTFIKNDLMKNGVPVPQVPRIGELCCAEILLGIKEFKQCLCGNF